MTFLYFAYGSNMLSERLVQRCPSARPIGPARVDGFELTFDKASTDGSGKAMLAADERDLACTPGVLFEIALADLGSLDRAEGAGQGYDRTDSFCVTLSETSEVLTASTYLATRVEKGLKPYDWYLALVVAGARQHALGERYGNDLRRTGFIIDDQKTREERRIAMRVLEASGNLDHRDLLES